MFCYRTFQNIIFFTVGKSHYFVNKQLSLILVSANYHHMACHDYTNKVHYQMPSMESCPRPSPTPATLVTSTTSVTSNKSRRHVVYSSRPKYGGRYGSSSSSVSGSNKIRSHGGGRKSKSSIEDPDYLAHGTGIPRLVSHSVEK